MTVDNRLKSLLGEIISFPPKKKKALTWDGR